MSKINNLIKELCPNGVRYYKDESYRKVYEEMKTDNILRQEDVNFISLTDNNNEARCTARQGFILIPTFTPDCLR